MVIEVGKLAGFCQGVEITVNKANEILDAQNEVYCLGEIVHNLQVIKKLENKGMKTVENIEDIPDGKKVIFRAHGEAKYIYNRAKEKNLEIFDLTCGKVKAIHMKVERESKNSFIIIVGKRKHPEIIGTKGFAGPNSFVVENEDDILDAFMEYEKTNLGQIYIVSQTTFSSEKFDDIAKEIEYNFAEADVVIDKTICDATENRQLETKKMARKFHTMIIIGGKNSSNTKELGKIAKENCKNVLQIETAQELKNINFQNVENIGIMAGASTPQFVIDEVKEYLEKYNNITI